MDYYLNDDNCVNRLLDEYKKYGSIIVAYDFDNTVFDYHNKGHEAKTIIPLLQLCREMGFHLTVFTSCNDDRFPDMEIPC